jgi:hypothetical protein
MKGTMDRVRKEYRAQSTSGYIKRLVNYLSVRLLIKNLTHESTFAYTKTRERLIKYITCLDFDLH